MLAELLESPDLFMMQVEMDAYTLAKKVCASMHIHTFVCVHIIMGISIVSYVATCSMPYNLHFHWPVKYLI